MIKNGLKYVLLLLVLAGCSTPAVKKTDQINQKTIEQSATGPQEKPKEESSQGRVYSNKGIYIGRIDSNTIEIKTPQGTKAYRLTEKTQEELKKLKEKDEVIFTFNKIEQGQNILGSLEQYQNSSPPKQQQGNSPATGKTEGIDPKVLSDIKTNVKLNDTQDQTKNILGISLH